MFTQPLKITEKVQDLNNSSNTKPISKEIYFIWFGSLIPAAPSYPNFWSNILLAKLRNSSHTVNLYIDSLIIGIPVLGNRFTLN